MKKILILLAAALVAVPTFAQKTTVTRVNREKTYKTQNHDLSIWYQGEVNIGYGMAGSVSYKGDSADAEYSRIFVETIHGARITQYAFVGLGVGFQYAWDYEEEVIPIFVDLKGYYPVNDNFAPYVAFDLGYGATISNFDGGFYGSFGAGLNYKKLNFGLGYQMQGIGGGLKLGSFFLKVGMKF